MLRFKLLFVVSMLSFLSFGQIRLFGTILDEKSNPIPFAKVYIKQDAGLRTVANVEGYYEIRLFPGEYYLVYSATGFEDRETYVSVADNDVERPMQLFPSKVLDLEEVEASAKKSNPGREIMLKVVEQRERMNPWNYPHSCEVYIKAKEKVDREESKSDQKKEEKERKKAEKQRDKEGENTNLDPSGIEDPFAEKRKEQTELANSMNLVEAQITRHYAPINKVKEFRNAFEERGNTRNLYYTTTVKSNFNFFENLLHLSDLHQTPVSSPISGPGILSYKYRLVEQYEENGQKIHKIKIIPRNIATTTLEGYIWVIDSTWMIQKLDLTMEKGNLLIYDYFQIQQEFETLQDSLCVLKKQQLLYGIKYKDEVTHGSTFAQYDEYNFNPGFTKKYFNNELSVTEKEAYDKDSTFWAQSRKTILSDEEKAYIIAKDSIRDYYNRKEYLDSIDANFNKITALKVLWFGIDHRNREKKYQWTISSVAATARLIYIAGPRVAPSFYYFKKWENEMALDSYTETSMGFLNQDFKGSTWWRYRYAPFHFGTATFKFQHDFDVIRGYDAITQIYKRENFIEVTELQAGNEYELFNGFYADINLKFSERRGLEGYKFLTIVDDALPNTDPLDFQPYQAFISELSLSYTPGQKYMREPKRKVVLGSKYPTFYADYERGIPKIFGSDIDHEYLRVGVQQTFNLGLLGTTSYHVTSGKFLSSKNLQWADFKFQRRSDPIWFSNPLYSFQGLDSSLPSRDIFYEFHLVHHDNGAIINKIPFMKKTRIGLVAGIGGLYVKEFDWQHYEALAGLERNFKFSKRRLRVGIYGVISDGNQIKPKGTWKISFALLDDRNMKWNF